MEKSITELKLGDLEAVVGGIDMAVTATAHEIPHGGSTSGTMNQPPRHPAPPRRPTPSLL